jgi:hypothetical protein
VVLLVLFPIATLVGAARARGWAQRIAILIVVPAIGIFFLFLILITVAELNGP